MMQTQCYVPFREYVPAGSSTFSIPVPTYFADQEFYFSYVTLTPSIFSDQAAKMDLDTEEELEQKLNYEISYQGEYIDGIPLFPDSLLIPATETNVIMIVDTINTFFEKKKPVGFSHLGMFIDWYDMRFELMSGITWDYFVQNVMSYQYYGVPYDEELHFNKLPKSARSVPGANNYLFPTSRISDVMDNIRFRINIAPNTNVVYSTNSQLLAMGFSLGQIGKRKKNNKLKMENNIANKFNSILAQFKPTLTLLHSNQLTIGLEPHSNFFVSTTFQFTLTKKENLKNLNYRTKLTEAMQEFALKSNLIFGLSYDETAKKFSFEFPNNPAFNYFVIKIPSDLSERLGFNLATDITKDNKTGQKCKDADDFNIDETANEARALCLDTALVLVSDYYNNSISTAKANSAYMTALYPTSTGTYMETPLMESCHSPPTMTLPLILPTSEGFILPKFKLSRFLDNNNYVNFVWTKGAYISGIFRGRKVPNNYI